MRAVFGFEDETDRAHVADFHGWLLETREVARAAEIGLRQGRTTGAMSAGDAIVVIASAVSSLAAVVQAYAAWRSARQDAPALIVIFEDGGTVTVVRGSAQEAELVMRTAEGAHDKRALPTPVLQEGQS